MRPLAPCGLPLLRSGASVVAEAAALANASSLCIRTNGPRSLHPDSFQGCTDGLQARIRFSSQLRFLCISLVRCT